ncbi:MAG: hypothetical protein AB7O62_24605 [Pirellulales bacterium]
MSSITDIEAAIEQLPPSEVEQLALWLERFRARRTAAVPISAWLASARGTARPGVTTAGVMALTRGEE